MAVRLVFRIRTEFCVDYSLQEFFDAPTVAGIVDTVLQKLTGALPDEDLGRLIDEVTGIGSLAT
jgi:hypothetical protein